MALMNNAATYLNPEHFCEPKQSNMCTAMQVLRADSFRILRNPMVSSRCLVVKASGRVSKKIDMINGKKVNGIHVNGGSSQLGQKRISEILNDDDEEPEKTCLPGGRFLEGRLVFRQTFVIRSYEIGPDKTATMETLMNLLQETALNHVRRSGLAGNGFGATHEMSLRKLIWVVTRINIQVDKYSSWGDVIEIDTWVDAAGKNGMRRDWIIRDFNSQNIITRATSTWVIMNRETRRLSKIPEEVKREVEPFHLNRVAISTEDIDSEKIEKLNNDIADRIRSGLAPRWSDMDANQHVNNVKYIGWILESVPMHVLEDYNLSSLTLEYRRECRQSNMLDSLTSMKTLSSNQNNSDTLQTNSCTSSENNQTSEKLQCTHLLRMETDHAEIVRARSTWQPKQHPSV
ncbi:Acyl-[acyl-carrier-protein] hydrolase [Heracleum sosnowskyi]|uniref:Acyl-[acyl-carrier-protein] hydrolase n=1 Tax=Heracleum sosnowskyi TaxID=360622 RepID=A0AAD8M394_9APIA|nr:Acyl-[acyl-carrier-protein] hydrolase [Heracleum sosnowskyi]